MVKQNHEGWMARLWDHLDWPLSTYKCDLRPVNEFLESHLNRKQQQLLYGIIESQKYRYKTFKSPCHLSCQCISTLLPCKQKRKAQFCLSSNPSALGPRDNFLLISISHRNLILYGHTGEHATWFGKMRHKKNLRRKRKSFFCSCASFLL